MDVVAFARARNAPLEVLFKDVGRDEATLTDPKAVISWPAFRKFWRNAGEIWSDDELVVLGRQLIHLDSFRGFVRTALSLGDPIDCLRMTTAGAQHQFVSCVVPEFKQYGGGKVHVGMRMSEGFEVCPQYFLFNKGFFESLPTIFGYPMASVEMFLSDREAVLEIEIHAMENTGANAGSPWKRLRGYLGSRMRISEAGREFLTGFKALRSRAFALGSKHEEFERSQKRFIQIFQSAPTAMLISRASDMRVVEVNESLLSLTGYPREVVIAWGLEEMRVWATVEERDVVQSTILAPGGSLDGREIRIRHRDGHEMVALLSAKPVDLAGEPCILWQAVDVTARKQTELELAENRDRLEDLVAERTRELERSLDSLKQVERLASIGTLAAGVAHQINNPIASIRAASEFALMCDDEPDAAVYYREALETCVEQSDRCGLIVRNILRFSRGESGARSHVDLRQLIVRSCNVVASYAAENGTTLEIDAGESELPVLVNSIEIEQVFVNVLRNAIESGDGTTRVEVLARRLETGAIVEIRDDGAGIDAAHLPFLFDPFYTTRLERGGTGLGLSVAHGIVNAHGGAIRADTEIDHGTAFQIQIPLEVPTPARPHLVSVS